MKSFFIKLIALFFAVLMYSVDFNLSAQIVMTFQVDLRDVNIEPGTEIGLRGDMPPLTWDKSLLMEDPEKDSIYSVKVIFNEGKPGDRVMYKYMVGETWDNDRYGPYGNRIATLSNCSQVLPVDKWDALESFALEFLLQDAVESEIYPWIYLISNAKTNGLSAEEVVIRYTGFWEDGYDWLQDPHTLMVMAEFQQAKFMHGYFEVIENTPGRAVFKVKNNWAEFVEIRGEKGRMMGVTGKDLTDVNKTWYSIVCKEKGWKFDWEEDGMFAVITIAVE
jgi:hypothetical protein